MACFTFFPLSPPLFAVEPPPAMAVREGVAITEDEGDKCSSELVELSSVPRRLQMKWPLLPLSPSHRHLIPLVPSLPPPSLTEPCHCSGMASSTPLHCTTTLLD
jgi:hypothetical protein